MYDITPRRIAVITAGALATLVLIIAIFMGTSASWKAFDRYQKRANANNNVAVSEIQIRNQEQRVKIAQQKAQIRRENAVGIRAAQDEIAKTLTPLYVQYEMTEALREIAKSGKNSSVVYIPSGESGVPIITGQKTK